MLNLKFDIIRRDNYNYFTEEIYRWYNANGMIIEHWHYYNDEDGEYDTQIREVTNVVEDLEQCIFTQLKIYSESVREDTETIRRHVTKKEDITSIDFEKDFEDSYKKTTLYITINNDLIEKSEWIKDFIKTVEKVEKEGNIDIKSYCDGEVVEGMIVKYCNKKVVV